VEQSATWPFWAKAYHIVWTDFNSRAYLKTVNKLALIGPVQLAEPSLIVGAGFLLPLHPSVSHDHHSGAPSGSSAPASCRAYYNGAPYMLKRAFISLVACPVLLKEAARRDLVGVIHVQEFAVVPLLALIR